MEHMNLLIAESSVELGSPVEQTADVTACQSAVFTDTDRPSSGRHVSPRYSSGPSGHRSVVSSQCIAPVCLSQGLDVYRGLCADCHAVLVNANSSLQQQQQQQIPTSHGLLLFSLADFTNCSHNK